MSLFRLTGREAEVLAVMLVFRDEPDGELAYERGSAYLGNTPLSARLVFGLIRKMCISERGEPSPVEHYYVNEAGTRALRDHWGIAARAAAKDDPEPTDQQCGDMARSNTGGETRGDR